MLMRDVEVSPMTERSFLTSTRSRARSHVARQVCWRRLPGLCPCSGLLGNNVAAGGRLSIRKDVSGWPSFCAFCRKGGGCFSLAGCRILCEFSKGADFSTVFPRHCFLSIPAISQHLNHL